MICKICGEREANITCRKSHDSEPFDCCKKCLDESKGKGKPYWISVIWKKNNEFE